LFKQWTYKYPRGHFLLNGIFYYPLLKHWQTHPVKVIRADGRTVSQPLNLQRLDLLAKITRIISVVMGTGTVVIVFLTAIWLFHDYLVALLSALALTLSQLFMYYCHQGNLYVPYVFWYALGFYWMVKAIYAGKLHHYIFMGLCFSLSICTYDAVGGYLAGMALAFWLALISKGIAEGESFRTAVLSVFSKKVLAAVVAFLLSYALLQDILTFPRAFADRMSIWVGGRGVVDFNKGFRGQLPLLWQACQMLYGSLGWPLLATAAVSLVYLSIKQPWKSVFLIIPLIAFYLVVAVNIRMFCPRYLLPAFIGLALLIGKGCADWLRYKKLHICLRVIPVGLIYFLSLLYCIGVDLEMLSDTRIRTEQWFYRNVRPDSIIGVGIYNIIYAPRLHLNGYRIICPWRSSDVQEAPGQSPSYPEYLIMTPLWPCVDDEVESKFREKLFDGQLNYDRVAEFAPKYLYPARTIFGFAGWPIPKLGTLSPEIIVFKKKPKDAGYGG
ncbi:MAG: hypothetical protein MUP16_10615, partial [Sedimentisphaerales bacterium]|nr:hypothetical protein [Sedimentisphaerales bacterium]